MVADGGSPVLREAPSSANQERERFRHSWSSDESGFQDYDGDRMETSVTSSLFTSSINLSPVKEAREPGSFLTSPEEEEEGGGATSITVTETVITAFDLDGRLLLEPEPFQVEACLVNMARASHGRY